MSSPVIEQKKISTPLFTGDVFSRQDFSEVTERNLTQTSLGRIRSELIYMNGNPGMGLASGIQMAFAGSCHSLFTSLLCNCWCIDKDFLLCLSWRNGGQGGMDTSSISVLYYSSI